MQVYQPMSGQLTPCPKGHQPKHYHVRGADLHFLECSPCGTRTAKYDTFQQAVEAWEQTNTETFDTRRTA